MEIINFILHVDTHLAQFIVDYGKLTYAIIAGIIFAETGFVFTPFLPGDSLLFAAGMLAAIGSLNVFVLAGLLWLAAVVGDSVNYWMGYYFGQKIVNNKYIPISEEHIAKTQEFYQKHGGKTVIMARFMPILRTFAPFVAGIGKMDYRKFLSFSVGGGFLWVFGFLFLGYFFGNIPLVKDNFSFVIIGIVLISVAPAIIKLLKEKLKNQVESS